MDTKALRQKILDLAIRGKLVPQDPNDEPASVLLERIRAEKQQMVKDGKLKAKDIKNDTVIFKGADNLHYEQLQDGTVKCIEDEIPFELPGGWSWTRLTSICSLISDIDHKMPKAVDDGVLFLSAKDLLNDGTINYTDDVKMISEKDFLRLSRKALPQKNDIIYSRIGACLGKARVVTKDIRFIVSYSCCTIRPVIIDSTFLASVLDGNFVLNQAKKGTQSVGVPDLGMASIKQFLIPIPPLVEQQRIDKRLQYALNIVQQIYTDCDDLSMAVVQAKSKILDLAIRGKLVPQNPDDEPASVLLERIRAEKEELIKQGKIKRDKKESVIFKGDDNSYYEKIGDEITCIDDELPFEIPDNWCWARLSSFTEVIMGSSPRSQDICKDSNYTEFHQGKIYFSDCLLKESNQYTKKISKIAPKNSVLLCVRAPVGEVNITDREICIGRGLSSIHAYDKIQSNFLFYWLKTQKHVLVNKSTGSTFSAITVDTVKKILLPIPPITEQLRITQKILDLNSNIESIKASLL